MTDRPTQGRAVIRLSRDWTAPEDAIIDEQRANGRVAIKAALRRAGYDRSLDQIKGRIATRKRESKGKT